MTSEGVTRTFKMMRDLPPSTTESRMIAQVRSILRQHKCRVWVGGAHLQIRHPLIAATGNAAVLCSQLLKPVMPLGILLGEGSCSSGESEVGSCAGAGLSSC